MNKKGFTLVELLAVIVILALLALLTSTAVTKLVRDAKNDLSETQIQLIKSAADTWVADNLNKLPSSGGCGYLTLEDLKYYGLLDNVILNPKNSEEIPNDLKIKITTTTSTYGNPVTNAEVNPDSIEGCEALYSPSCIVIQGTGTSPGDKISCTYSNITESFYVINNDGKNIKMLTEYNIDIMTKLQSQTAGDIKYSDSFYWVDSSNNLLSKYSTSYPAYVYDENSNLYSVVESYVTTLKENGVEGVIGNLLSYEEAIELGCSYPTTGFGTCSKDWLNTTSYWLGSAGSNNTMWIIDDYFDHAADGSTGIRPVIIIPVIELQNNL
ncbi:MAG: prepilin-type N-terminal cleavage/methylation domain-containing protein [Bacilli bacterium]|nr:prepilin-type N-terminal cleavage/methylation domain-containing protein [Bacilli bacterium]